VTAYPDTSFLCAFYVKQTNSTAAAAHAATMKEPLYVTELLDYEFRQWLRFQVWRRTANPREGMAQADAQAALNQYNSDMANGVAVLAPCPLADVLHEAEKISACHTITGGHRSFDVLHVATALVLSAEEFLTFDANQRRLVTARAVAFAPGGDVFASGSKDGTIRFWSPHVVVTSRSEEMRLSGSWILAADGGHLVTLDTNGVARIVELTTMKEQAQASLGVDPRLLAVSNGGRWLAWREAELRVMLWDASRPTESPRGDHLPVGLQQLSFSPDGRLVITADQRGLLNVIDASDWRPLSTFDAGVGDRARESEDLPGR
jgi:predicted nucleic acid-binding protein